MIIRDTFPVEVVFWVDIRTIRYIPRMILGVRRGCEFDLVPIDISSVSIPHRD